VRVRQQRQPRRTGGLNARTVGDLLRYAVRRLRRARLAYGHGTTNAAEEAPYLVASALGTAPGSLPGELRRRPSPRQRAAALRLIERRIRERKPAAYLLRAAWLAGHRLYVDERAIVPRSHLAPLLRECLAPWVPEPGRIQTALDLCTGSGCLAVLLARSFPRARIDASDVSKAALAVASINVGRYGLGRRIRLIESDLFSTLGAKRYDLIISNPPYVTAARMRRLPHEYRHEPRIALAGGADGLALVRRIMRAAAAHLNPGALLVVEVGAGKRRVERAFPNIEFVWPDMVTGHPVFLVSREQLLAGRKKLTDEAQRKERKTRPINKK
jgi:ribosomal protein L3 glutamine methyltransferase